MIPSRRLLVVLAALAGFGLGASLWPQLQPTFVWLALATAAIASADFIWLLLSAPPEVERAHRGTLPLGVPSQVELTLTNPLRRRQRLEVFDHYPAHAVAAGMPRRLRVDAEAATRLDYRLTPMQRGLWQFEPAELRVWSALGWWQRRYRSGAKGQFRVYPNFAPILKYSLLATENRLSQMGIKQTRRRGEGLQFKQLRDYRVGDALRQIDWNASARVRKLISREYEDEKDQEVIFLLDCGRRMRSEDGELTHFDHALNAILLLSHVALRQGDAVGVMSFSGEHRWLAPRKGVAAVNTILNALYDIHPGLQTPDYSRAARDLMLRHRKRALVVLVTNLRDEDADDLLPALKLLRQRHLVLLASLREKVIDDTLATQVHNLDSALEYAAAHDYLAARQESHATIDAAGALLVDVTPTELPLAIVNRYLDAKRSGWL